ncbi:MAG TPA: heme-binding protein [Bryobacteraceae bacterium]|nr:heme-binding protein [Bryobacteraceae bacterium]
MTSTSTLTTPDAIVRASGPTTIDDLGLIHKLSGRWVGRGFNLIARPDRLGPANNTPQFTLALHATHETLQVNPVGGGIPNRGQFETAFLHAIDYSQTVTDYSSHTGIHKESGWWVHVPETKENPAGTYVRLATVPHGNSLVSQTTAVTTFSGRPTINPVNSLPIPGSDRVQPLNAPPGRPLSGAVLEQYLKSALPDGLPSGLDPVKTIQDPTEVLRADIRSQTITETDIIVISTLVAGGIVSIPFVLKNANAAQLDAIFWIETVKDGTSGRSFFQLQYVQRVILDFNDIHWPHISVATLVKE